MAKEKHSNLKVLLPSKKKNKLLMSNWRQVPILLTQTGRKKCNLANRRDQRKPGSASLPLKAVTDRLRTIRMYTPKLGERLPRDNRTLIFISPLYTFISHIS